MMIDRDAFPDPFQEALHEDAGSMCEYLVIGGEIGEPELTRPETCRPLIVLYRLVDAVVRIRVLTAVCVFLQIASYDPDSIVKSIKSFFLAYLFHCASSSVSDHMCSLIILPDENSSVCLRISGLQQESSSRMLVHHDCDGVFILAVPENESPGSVTGD